MARTIDVTSFHASKEYPKDFPLVDTYCAKLDKLAGTERIFRGIDAEDLSWGYVFHVRKHEALPEIDRENVGHDDMIESQISSTMNSFYESVSIPVDVALESLEHPITEIVRVTLKTPENKEKMDALFKKMTARYHGRAIGGPVIGKPDLWVYHIGWPNIETHHEALKKLDTEDAADGRTMKELAAFSVSYAALQPFETK